MQATCRALVRRRSRAFPSFHVDPPDRARSVGSIDVTKLTRSGLQRTPVTAIGSQVAELEGELAARFLANEVAHAFFESQPPGYKHIASYWVLSAKKPETRDKRLASLIACSAAHRRIPSLTPPGKK
jgi:hypothetical protein